MAKDIKRVVYTKPSSIHGIGQIPIGSEGSVLLYVDNTETPKLLVDFSPYGKAIVPLSSVKVI